jgi:hypothetical protein
LHLSAHLSDSSFPTSDVPTSDVPTSDVPTSDVPTSPMALFLPCFVLSFFHRESWHMALNGECYENDMFVLEAYTRNVFSFSSSLLDSFPSDSSE